VNLTQLDKAVVNTLKYSNQFNYPLTLREIQTWVSYPYPKGNEIQASLKKLLKLKKINKSGNLYFLPGRIYITTLRHRRKHTSSQKWIISKQASCLIQKIPFVEGLFITGSLSLNNADKLDDIDFMIITKPNTLWITRILVVLLLKQKNLRRSPGLPEHSSTLVSNKICDNLYLDLNHLNIPSTQPPGSLGKSRLFYLAHEILQAKPVFDRGGVHQRFLLANSWVQKYLSNAYSSQTKHTPKSLLSHSNLIIDPILFISNFLLYILQYVYMKPKIRNETVSMGFAFFHPNINRLNSSSYTSPLTTNQL
jgi:hypothetical protein